jgi:hypothetical protein
MKKRYLSVIAFAFFFGIASIFVSCKSEKQAEQDAQDAMNEMMQGLEEAVENIDTATVNTTIDQATEKVEDAVKDDKKTK